MWSAGKMAWSFQPMMQWTKERGSEVRGLKKDHHTPSAQLQKRDVIQIQFAPVSIPGSSLLARLCLGRDSCCLLPEDLASQAAEHGSHIRVLWREPGSHAVEIYSLRLSKEEQGKPQLREPP